MGADGSVGGTDSTAKAPMQLDAPAPRQKQQGRVQLALGLDFSQVDKFIRRRRPQQGPKLRRLGRPPHFFFLSFQNCWPTCMVSGLPPGWFGRLFVRCSATHFCPSKSPCDMGRERHWHGQWRACLFGRGCLWQPAAHARIVGVVARLGGWLDAHHTTGGGAVGGQQC